MDPIAEALKPVWGELGLTGPESSKTVVQVPYHGAKAVQSAVRAVLAATEADAQQPMVNNPSAFICVSAQELKRSIGVKPVFLQQRPSWLYFALLKTRKFIPTCTTHYTPPLITSFSVGQHHDQNAD
jgi:hypothetical protein